MKKVVFDCDWFRSKLDEMRNRRGSVAHLAKHMGCTEKTVYNILEGKTQPDMTRMHQLADYLGLKSWHELKLKSK